MLHSFESPFKYCAMKVGSAKNNAIFYCARMLLFVSLVLRFLIPQGFMIDDKANSGNHIRIVLCKSQGSELTTLDLTNAIIQSHKNDKGEKNSPNQNMDHCNYVGFNASIDLQTADLSFDKPFFEKATGISDKINVYIGNGLAAPPPPATGPPANA